MATAAKPSGIAGSLCKAASSTSSSRGDQVLLESAGVECPFAEPLRMEDCAQVLGRGVPRYRAYLTPGAISNHQ
jgi:hypothetical protein